MVETNYVKDKVNYLIKQQRLLQRMNKQNAAVAVYKRPII